MEAKCKLILKNPGRGKSRCKGPEAEKCPACSKHGKRARQLEHSEKGRHRIWGWWVGQWSGVQRTLLAKVVWILCYERWEVFWKVYSRDVAWSDSHVKKILLYMYNYFTLLYTWNWGFTGGSVIRSLPTSAGDVGPIPGWGRTPGEGNGNPLHYSCLENPMDRADWRAAVHGSAKEVDTT